MDKRFIKIISLILALCMSLSACSFGKTQTASVNTDDFNTNYKFIFVHGLSGWGSYDFQNHFIKYWGMQTGDLLKFLNDNGFECYSASVNPQGSAWDRACELYAQLTGTVVDYGKEHSERCKHERFGRDFSKKPLIDKWDSENKINLLGHSFGGATVRMLSTLMAEGCQAEIDATDEADISPLFTGGKADYIYSITALACPHNGTSAYEANDGTPENITKKQQFMSNMVNSQTKPSKDERVEYDYADYDLRIDNALELNETLTSLDNVYYFSFPCSSTTENEDGTYSPIAERTEDMFVNSAIKIGKHTGVTQGGFEITTEWLNNDGLVNTISATAPFNAKSNLYNADNKLETGIWYVMPTYVGDHMSLQGDIFLKNDVRNFYLEHLARVNNI